MSARPQRRASPTPAATAFWASSKPARPLTTRHASAGERPASTRAPVTLSTALCRPTSSRTTSSSPSAVASAAAWTPPVRSKTGCCVADEVGQASYDVGGGEWRRTSDRQAGAASASAMRVLAAHPAGGGAERRGDVPVAGVAQRRFGQRHGDDVELLVLGEVLRRCSRRPGRPPRRCPRAAASRRRARSRARASASSPRPDGPVPRARRAGSRAAPRWPAGPRGDGPRRS